MIASNRLFSRLALATLLGAMAVWSAAKPHRVIAYSQDSAALEGLFFPSAGKSRAPAPGIVLFPDWMGVTPSAEDYAASVSALGYAVFVADVYGKNVRPQGPEDAGKTAAIYKNDRSLMRARAMAALQTLKLQKGVDTSRIAAMGYCFGGTCALELGRSGAKLLGIVSLHGGLETPNAQDALNIRGKVLVLHGANDPYVPAEQVGNFMEEMKQAKVDWQMVFYGGAVHGFTNPKAPLDPKTGYAYQPEAARRSFGAMKAFYGEIFSAP